MTIVIGFLVVLLVAVFCFLWITIGDLRDMERSRDFWRQRTETQTNSTNEWKNLHDKEYDEVLKLRKENAALQKRLQELTPQTTQKPWWTEEN